MSAPRTLIAAAAIALCAASPALASSSSARPAGRSERAAIVAYYAANDGSASEVYAVYISRASSNLAVVCTRTPEAGKEAFVLRRSGRSWRYVTSGRIGRAGNATDRSLEKAC